MKCRNNVTISAMYVVFLCAVRPKSVYDQLCVYWRCCTVLLRLHVKFHFKQLYIEPTAKSAGTNKNDKLHGQRTISPGCTVQYT